MIVSGICVLPKCRRSGGRFVRHSPEGSVSLARGIGNRPGVQNLNSMPRSGEISSEMPQKVKPQRAVPSARFALLRSRSDVKNPPPDSVRDEGGGGGTKAVACSSTARGNRRARSRNLRQTAAIPHRAVRRRGCGSSQNTFAPRTRAARDYYSTRLAIDANCRSPADRPARSSRSFLICVARVTRVGRCPGGKRPCSIPVREAQSKHAPKPPNKPRISGARDWPSLA